MPNLAVRFMGGRVVTDKQGYRVTPCADDGTDAFCVLGLGDSVMFGWGVDDNQTYLAQLCDLLAQAFPGRRFRVLNTAVPGYNTVMEVETLKARGLAYRPGLVLIHFVDNDLYLPNFIRMPDAHMKMTRSYLVGALSRWRGGDLRTRPFERIVRRTDQVPEQCRFMVGEEAYTQAMRDLKTLGDEQAFKILLLVNWTAPEYVAANAAELGIPLLELGPVLRRYRHEHTIVGDDDPLTVSRQDPHFSPLAHGLIAEEIVRYVEQHALVP